MLRREAAAGEIAVTSYYTAFISRKDEIVMNDFPKMAPVRQSFDRPRCEAPGRIAYDQCCEGLASYGELNGKRIALACGSRGVSNLSEIVSGVTKALRERGAEAFVIPAMGSHGGGKAESQKNILLEYGLTIEKVGAGIVSSLETIKLGENPHGAPMFMDRHAFESDGVIVINRIKPHTDLSGSIESGLAKMIAVGLGKIDGARSFHSLTSMFDPSELIQSIAGEIIASGKIIGGLGVVENAYHETASVKWADAESLIEQEKKMLVRAKELMPSLPVKRADCLIVDFIGKNISGVGLDPQVTGRRYRINRRWQERPDITRIVGLNLTAESKGNAVGVGLLDFCSQRLAEAMDREATYLNMMTSRNVICANLPPHWADDRVTLGWAFQTAGKTGPEGLKVLHIRDTLHLTTFEASEALLPELRECNNVESIGDMREMNFDSHGRLQPIE